MKFVEIRSTPFRVGAVGCESFVYREDGFVDSESQTGDWENRIRRKSTDWNPNRNRIEYTEK